MLVWKNFMIFYHPSWTSLKLLQLMNAICYLLFPQIYGEFFFIDMQHTPIHICNCFYDGISTELLKVQPSKHTANSGRCMDMNPSFLCRGNTKSPWTSVEVHNSQIWLVGYHCLSNYVMEDIYFIIYNFLIMTKN